MKNKSPKRFRFVGSLVITALLLTIERGLTAEPPIVQQAYLKSPNTSPGQTFGYVAISGDTAVVGASDENSRQGAAYVFVRQETNWTFQARLEASDGQPLDYFGIDVGISGDTIVIGAAEEGSTGSAYVFVRNGTTWSQQARLKASNAEAGDAFYNVAISGDTVVVGATGEGSNSVGVNGEQNDNSAPFAGAVYVFVRNGTTWSQQAYLKASNTGSGDNFGGPVAISGNTIVVGAFLEDSNATGVNGNQNNNSISDSGAAYVFVRDGTTWSQQAYLKASNTGAGDFFGSVAISENTIAVGATYEDSNATGVNGNQSNNNIADSGAAYVFVRDGTNWSQQAYLKASNTGTEDYFAGRRRIAISGDIIVAGALFEASNATGINGNQSNNSARDSGAAYVFVRSGTNWSQIAYLKASNTERDDSFGSTVAVSGNTVIVGASNEASDATTVNGDQRNNRAPESGAAYVFAGFETSAPKLSINESSGSVRVSWPLVASGYVLDQTGALAIPPATTVWSTIPDPYESDGVVNFMTVPSSRENSFYRLRKP